MNEPSDKNSWSGPVDRLHVGDVGAEAVNLNVEGREPTGPLQGFGQMWQKTYRVEVGSVPPERVIQTWKSDYGRFWPPSSRFYAPITGIQPGEVGVINSKQGPVSLSTGVLVLYADETSFTFVTPQGHPFAGWVTFSAYQEDSGTIVQVQLLIRANDPLYEVGFMLGGSRAEDRMWQHTLAAVARHFGAAGEVGTVRVRVDRRRQWSRLGNIRYNSLIGTWLRRPLGWRDRKKS